VIVLVGIVILNCRMIHIVVVMMNLSGATECVDSGFVFVLHNEPSRCFYHSDNG